MKDLPRIRGRYLIARLVAEGEHDRQDFKFLISDARKIARSVSAFANAAGGRLLIGVKDNGTVAGVRNEEDIYLVEQAAERYCQPPQHVTFTAYNVDPGVTVIKADVSPAESRPVYCREADGSLRAYYRVADENIAAHPLLTRAWVAAVRPAAFSLDAESSAVLEAVNRAGAITPDDLFAAVAVSRRRCEDTIVRLTAAGILTFTYRHPHWHIIPAP